MAIVNIFWLGLAAFVGVFFFYLIKVAKFERDASQNESQRLAQYIGKNKPVKPGKKIKTVSGPGGKERK